MITTDALDQTISKGDWVIYGASGYQRIAKIMDITSYGNWGEVTVMTATDKGVYKRVDKQWSRDPAKCRFYSVVRIDQVPGPYEDKIEKRLAKLK